MALSDWPHEGLKPMTTPKITFQKAFERSNIYAAADKVWTAIASRDEEAANAAIAELARLTEAAKTRERGL